MDSNDKFETMLDQLSEIMNLLKEYAGKPIDSSKITPEVVQRLANLKRDIKEFDRLGQKLTELNEETRKIVEKNFGPIPEEKPTPRSRRLAEKLRKLTEQAETLKKIIVPIEAPKEEILPEVVLPQSQIVDDKTFRKRRRRKFKNFE